MDSVQTASVLSVQFVLAGLYIITALFVCLLIIFENRAPVKTLSWILVIALIPVLGIFLWFLFGQNYRKKKIFSRKGIIDAEYLIRTANEQKDSLENMLQRMPDKYKAWRHIMTLMLNNEKSVLTEKNDITLLTDVENTYSRMLNEIEKAEHHIHLQVYRFDIDNTGERFIELLSKKASEGVEVRVIFDDVGSWSFKKKYIDRVRKTGVRIYPFFPVRFPQLASKLNYRNHRKILVVDGKTGFIGGMNIAEKYLKGIPQLGEWKDTHLKVEGDAVAVMNRLFLTDWYFLNGEILTHNREYFPEVKTDGKSMIQIASSGPDSDWANIMQVYFSAIASAREKVYLCTPYFSPNESILNALKTTALSGKDVRLIIPQRSDSVIATWNSRSYVSELLDAGVRVYLYDSGFNHSKYIVIDGIFSSVGSVNIDMRSFDMNFEVTAIIYDEVFAAELEEVFTDDMIKSKEVLPLFWHDRSRKEKYRESVARIFGPLY